MAERRHPTPLTAAFQERATAELSTLNSRLNENLKKDIAREVYDRNILKHKEDAIVSQIRVLRGECETASPESDVFVTPKASPCETSGAVGLDWSPQKAYYSLVQIDDDNPHRSLERELAEQDELSKSFRSILIKETRHKPTKLSCGPTSQGNDESLKSLRPSKLLYQPLRTPAYQKSRLVLKLRNEPTDMSGKTTLQKEEDITSNPDSCLEPGSSGYATGWSPRDTNGSEARDTNDTTEVVTSEDIPHDDKSRGSSSVSSDPGTWDSTFPTNDDDTCIERENVQDTVVKQDQVVPQDKQPELNSPLDSKIGTRLEYQCETKDNYMCDLSENKDSFMSIKMEAKYSPPMNHHEFNPSSTISNNFFIDASSLRDENELYLPSIRNPIFPCTNIEPKTPICDEISQKSVIEKSDIAVRNLDRLLDKECENLVGLEEEEEEKKLFENRKLIRRNTFDLDPDDAQITKLKEEFDKTTHTPASSPTVDSRNKINKNVPYGIHSDCVRSHIPTKDEEVHSPDSLNNDFLPETHAGSQKQKINYPREEFISNNEDYCKELLEEAVEFERVTSTIENGCLNDGAVSSTMDEIENGLNPDKANGTSGLGTSPELANSYESHTPRKEEENTSGFSNGLLTKDNFFNKFECIPIVSGGAQMSDISSSEYSVSASPLLRRKTEFAPILSGGFDDLPPVEVKKVKPKVSSLSTSWVVDMSDTRKSPPESIGDTTRSERSRTSSSGMGFFVPLDDPYPSFDSFTSNSSAERSDPGHVRRNSDRNSNSSCGFYVDLKDKPNSKSVFKNDVPSQEKKLFSMFIDIGNSDSTSPKSKPGSPFFSSKRAKGPSMTDRLSAKHLDKKSNSTSSDSGLDLVEHPELAKGRLLFNETLEHSQNFSDSSNNDSGFVTKRQSFYMFIGSEESPIPRRRTLPPGIKQNPNRHSWNNNYENPPKPETSSLKKEHKRSSSVSCDQTFTEDKLTSGPMSIEENLLKKRERNKSMLSSWHGPIKPTSELSKIISNGAKLEFREKSKELNKSLENSEGEKAEDMSCSIKSDEVFDVSNATVSSKDDANRTFIVDDVSKDVNVNTNDLELSTPSQDIVSELSKDDSLTDPVQEHKSSSSNATNRSDAETPKQAELSNSQMAVARGGGDDGGGFVRLSDMDRGPPPLAPAPTAAAALLQTWASSSPTPSKRTPARMSRSIPEASFLSSSSAAGGVGGCGGGGGGERVLTTSASTRSLSRLFPHLYPGSGAQSLQSSLQSSIVQPSPLEVSTEEEGSTTSGGGDATFSRLGEDLLRMFLDEISPDVTVEVGGRRIKAHKCILSSRCQYFAGMLSGGWVESAGNVISLQGFSYNTVHFALCHIYSGASQIPETISLVELATLADMLCLEGLKEVIMYTLKVKYCHFFHKPCPGCLVGVVECLPLAAAYSLDEIYRKGLRWLTRYFVKVWPTKGFASLPKELHDKCFKQHVVHMSCENVLETVMGCDKLDATIPNVRWANPVFALNSKLHEASVKYLGQHFSSMLASQAFMRLGEEDCWTVTRLEETLLNVSKALSPDQACQSYKRIKIILANINKVDPHETDWKLEFLELLTSLEGSIEDCLIRQAGRAARTTSWTKLDLALRRKIQEAACLVFTPGPRPASATREPGRGTKSGGDGKPKSPATSTISHPKKAPAPVAPLAQPGKSQPSPPAPSKPRTPKSLSQKSFPQRQSVARLTKSAVDNKLDEEKVKSRYLDPKPARREPSEPGAQQASAGPRRASGGGCGSGKVISSSDSSRTSSPATGQRGIPRPSERRSPIAGPRRPGLATSLGRSSSPLVNSKEQRTTTSRDSDLKTSTSLKRQSTFRVATKASSAKQVSPGGRGGGGSLQQGGRSGSRPLASSAPTKSNLNNNNNNNGRSRQSSGLRANNARDDASHLTKFQHSN